MFSACSVEKAGWEKKVSAYGLIWMSSLSGCVRSDFFGKGTAFSEKNSMEWISCESCFFGTVGFQIPICRYSHAGSLTHTQMQSEGIMQSRSHTLSDFYAGGSQPLLRLLYISRRMPGKTKGKRSWPRSSDRLSDLFKKWFDFQSLLFPPVPWTLATGV